MTPEFVLTLVLFVIILIAGVILWAAFMVTHMIYKQAERRLQQ